MSQQESVLKNYLSKYKHQNETKNDIINTINQYRDLRPSFEPFVFNDGTQRQLVQLEGTIPVNYKGSTYNIPISLWILDTYPYNPPMVFVKPTPTMQIRPGKYVDSNGKVDMPFIREWRHPSSDLLSLVQILTFTFGEECPVFSRTAIQRTSQNLSYPNHTPYPPSNPVGGMPMPGMPGATPPYPQPSVTGGSGYPGQGYPPYPTAGGYPNSTSTPPYPGYGPASQSTAYPPSTQPGGYPLPYPSNSSNPPYPGIQPQPQSSSYSSSGGYPPYPTNNVGNANVTPGGTVTEADLRASLLSAVEDKMKRRLKETFAQAQAEMDVLTKTENDLNAGKQKLETILSDLEKEKGVLERNMHILTSKSNELKEALEKMEGSEEIDIDEAVVTTTPLYKQLVNAFAEEQAIEDAIYYLSEGLRRNVIELESFLKRVRELSRNQFMLRATIQKCREKAGLPSI